MIHREGKESKKSLDRRDKRRGGKGTPMVLVVFDGWGVAPPSQYNAIFLARTPVMDSLYAQYPNTTLEASGEAVGLLPGQDGNSEAGHMNIGAGRVVPQDVLRISKSIQDGTFFRNPAFKEAVQHVKRNHSRLHVMGVITDWHSAHANPEHLRALLDFARKEGVKEVYLHLFTDGRDTPPYAGKKFVQDLQSQLQEHERIATVMGRLYLDRKKDWSRTNKAYHALVIGEGLQASDPVEAVEEGYQRGETDEYIMPTVICREGRMLPRIGDKDAVIFFNLRSDRARQLTKPFVQKRFNALNPGAFKRKRVLKDLTFVAMTDFGPDLGDTLSAFPSPDVRMTLPMVLKDLVQYYIAETEKYAHMTYFFNGGYANPVGGERRVHVESPRVHTYEAVPEMAAREITHVVLETLQYDIADFIGINYANADMLAHTGNLAATIKAVETLDSCLGKIVEAVRKRNGAVVITGDHGNAEHMYNAKTGQADTEHSNHPVPFIIVSEDCRQRKVQKGVLGDVAPTILEILEIEKPSEMTGKSLFVY